MIASAIINLWRCVLGDLRDIFWSPARIRFGPATKLESIVSVDKSQRVTASSSIVRARRRVAAKPAIYLTRLSSQRSIPSMEWEVEYTDEFEGWWNSLSESEQESIDSYVRML